MLAETEWVPPELDPVIFSRVRAYLAGRPDSYFTPAEIARGIRDDGKRVYSAHVVKRHLQIMREHCYAVRLPAVPDTKTRNVTRYRYV